MDLEFDPNSDLQSLSGVTLNEEPEVNVEQDELLGAGSNFHWRIRMTPPSTRRFPLTTHTRNREVIAKLSCRRLPSTIAEFRDFVNSRCPNTEGRGFRLRCCVWPTSPYAVVPVQFSEDLHFSTSHSDEIGEISELENAKYRNLVNGCRQFATNCPRREVEFEIKILFSKVVGAAAERK